MPPYLYSCGRKQMAQKVTPNDFLLRTRQDPHYLLSCMVPSLRHTWKFCALYFNQSYLPVHALGPHHWLSIHVLHLTGINRWRACILGPYRTHTQLSRYFSATKKYSLDTRRATRRKLGESAESRVHCLESNCYHCFRFPPKRAPKCELTFRYTSYLLQQCCGRMCNSGWGSVTTGATSGKCFCPALSLLTRWGHRCPGLHPSAGSLVCRSVKDRGKGGRL